MELSGKISKLFRVQNFNFLGWKTKKQKEGEMDGFQQNCTFDYLTNSFKNCMFSQSFPCFASVCRCNSWRHSKSFCVEKTGQAFVIYIPPFL